LENLAFPRNQIKKGVFTMEKKYRIYSDSDATAKNNVNEKKEPREVSEQPQNNVSYYMASTKDSMTSNKVYSMY